MNFMHYRLIFEQEISFEKIIHVHFDKEFVLCTPVYKEDGSPGQFIKND